MSIPTQCSLFVGGYYSRNLLVDAEHPDAWIVITGAWSGLSVEGGAAVGCPTTDLPAAPVWTRGGQR